MRLILIGFGAGNAALVTAVPYSWSTGLNAFVSIFCLLVAIKDSK